MKALLSNSIEIDTEIPEYLFQMDLGQLSRPYSFSVN